MKEDIACCGYKCKICPAYKNNITDKDSQEKVSDGWFKYYGFRIPAEDIYCDGCLPTDCENPRRIDTKCPVRPCVLEKVIPNCAHCDRYVCDKLSTRIVNPDEVVQKNKGEIPEEDFDRFVRVISHHFRWQ